MGVRVRTRRAGAVARVEFDLPASAEYLESAAQSLADTSTSRAVAASLG